MDPGGAGGEDRAVGGVEDAVDGILLGVLLGIRLGVLLGEVLGKAELRWMSLNFSGRRLRRMTVPLAPHLSWCGDVAVRMTEAN